VKALKRGLLLLAALAAALPVIVMSEELQPGQQYVAGVRVDAMAEGISFSVPAEWIGGLPAQSPIFMFGSNSRPGLGMVIMRQATTWQDAVSMLNQPQDLGNGVVLMPVAEGRKTERGYEIDFSNTQYTGHAVARIGDAGNGVVVFFGGPANNSQYYLQLAQQTAESVRFNQPQIASGQQQWYSMLAGMMLKRMSSYYSGGLDGAYVGASSSESLHLCSDGSFAYFSSSSIAADGGVGGGYNASGYEGASGAQTGQWSIEAMGAQTLLVLRDRNGEFSQHSLQFADGNTLLDGDRVYRVKSDRCQ